MRYEDEKPIKYSDRRRAPFLWINKAIFAQKWRLLSPGARSIYVTFCACADGDHSEEGFELTQASLMYRNRMSRASVWRATNELVANGLIRVEYRTDETGQQMPNHYVLLE